MNFDVVIIGGGLAGLTCGIALQQSGKRCAIINNGQAAIDFASGSFDLLSRLPDGHAVSDLADGLAQLAQQLPNHPYSILGASTVLAKAEEFSRLSEQLNLDLVGSNQQNHWRVTALGSLRGA